MNSSKCRSNRLYTEQISGIKFLIDSSPKNLKMQGLDVVQDFKGRLSRKHKKSQKDWEANLTEPGRRN